MRVLHVNDHDPATAFGGAEVYLARLVAAQRERGDEVDVLFARPGSRVRDLWDPRARADLRERVAATAPDVVHVHGFVRELSPSVLTATGVPTVLTFHDLRLLGGSEHRLPDPRAVAARLWVEPVSLRLTRRVRAVTGVSDAVTAELRRAGLPRPSTLPVPVGPPVHPPSPVEGCADVLFAGRLSPDKGVTVAVRAFAEVADRHPGSRLLVAGDGPLDDELRRTAGPRVALLGRLHPDEVSRVMGTVRVVVVPSLPELRREGSSLTAVEAARHGRPLVASDDPAVAEIACRTGGDVVAAGDVAALAARLDHWLGDGAAAAANGARAAGLAAVVHDPAAVAAAAAELYRSIA